MRDDPPGWFRQHASHSPIRRVDRPDSPFPGTLARAPDGTTVLLVDRALLSGWTGWGAAPDGHVLAPADIVLRPGGHDVVLPAVAERVDRFLARRAEARLPLSAGEAVTLAVSLVRGIGEALGLVDDLAGEWWLTDDGRPVVVAESGEETVRRATTRLCLALAEHIPGTALAQTLTDLAAELENGRPLRGDAQMWEDDLFACASAEPLAVDAFGPRHASPRIGAAPPDSPPLPVPSRPWWGALAFHVDAGLADAVSDVVHRALERMRRARLAGGRARPIILAAGAAGLVLAAGLLWPSDTDDASAGTPPPAETASSSAPSPTHEGMTGPPPAALDAARGEPPSEGDGPDAVMAGDLVGVTSALLDALSGCGAAAACRAGILEDPAREIPAGPATASGQERAVTLVDDFGDVAVLRAGGAEATQLVTIVRAESGWRVRDVLDVADPPP